MNLNWLIKLVIMMLNSHNSYNPSIQIKILKNIPKEQSKTN
jgi:hypothetical protein